MNKQIDIKTISEKIAAKNRWTTIKEEKFSIANGKTHEYLIVERMPALMIIPVIVVNGEIYTYLVKQFRYPINKEIWQFPMGTLEDNTDPKIHALKELKEETGLVAEGLKLVGKYFTDPGLSRQQCFVYIAENITQVGKQNLEESELGMVTKKFSLNELENLIAENRLIDGWIYSGYYFLKQFLGKESKN